MQPSTENTVVITDMLGKILKKINVQSAGCKINISIFLPGSYMIVVKNRESSFVAKFLKE